MIDVESSDKIGSSYATEVALAQVGAALTTIDLLRSQLAEATAQTEQVWGQRDGAYARNECLEKQLAQLRQERDVRQYFHHSERQDAAMHFLATEERLNRKVDRARNEPRGLSESLAKQVAQSRSALQTPESPLSQVVC